jgi:phosphatidylethanolamine/phosphatidyl-N-methylethanolamine N-methyltransferase
VANSGLGLFLKQFWQQYHTTGAIWPSGPYLAKELAYFLNHDVASYQSKPTTTNQNGQASSNSSGATSNSLPRRILEVGPGTGALTGAIIEAMQPNDTLTLVEVNPDFVAYLQNRLNTEPAWQAVAPRTAIVTKLIQDYHVDEPFDRIVSGLPLNNFPVDVVHVILEGFERLAKQGATVSFFEYIAIRKFKAVVSSKSTRERLKGIAAELKTFFGKREIRCQAVWRNLTPAWAHHVKIGA